MQMKFFYFCPLEIDFNWLKVPSVLWEILFYKRIFTGCLPTMPIQSFQSREWQSPSIATVFLVPKTEVLYLSKLCNPFKKINGDAGFEPLIFT